MKYFNKASLTIATSIFILTSCGEISNEIAKDNLSGTYSCEVTYKYKYSLLNIGMDDQQKTEKCRVSIMRIGKETLMTTSDGMIKITGLKLLIDGASFNIPQQRIVSTSQTALNIVGNPIFTDTEDNKMDGALDDKNNFDSKAGRSSVFKALTTKPS